MASVGTTLYRSTKPGTSATSLAVICSATGLPYMTIEGIRHQCNKGANEKCGPNSRQVAPSALRQTQTHTCATWILDTPEGRLRQRQAPQTAEKKTRAGGFRTRSLPISEMN